jgi:hypoxanthine phosphoribosyltransferase
LQILNPGLIKGEFVFSQDIKIPFKSMDKIRILDIEFRILITSGKIQESVERMADKMNRDLQDKNVIFLGILNGAFMFASDLIRRIKFDCEVSFLKLATYEGSFSTGSVKRLIGLDEDIANKTVVILEDVIDTGFTMENILKQLKGYDPEYVKVATMFFKPGRYSKKYNPDYIGIEIPDNFIVGYGLDYKGYGRNLKDIYIMTNY